MKFNHWYTQCKQAVKDRLFPVFCLVCDAEGEWVCASCLPELDTASLCLCPVCHEPQDYGLCCSGCAKYSAIDSHIACAEYERGALVSKILESLKYNYILDVVPVIAQLIIPHILLQYTFLSQFDYIVPVPLHKKRFAERGFNQSVYIADIVSSVTEVEVVPALVRSRYTTQQATLEKEEREHNMEDVFTLTGIDILGKDILLVDDVYTTGSTMQAAARVLREGGAASVASLSVARG